MDGPGRQENQEVKVKTPEELKHDRATDFASKRSEKSRLSAEKARLEKEGVDPDSEEAISTDKALEEIRQAIKDMQSKENRRGYQKSLTVSKDHPSIRREIETAKRERERARNARSHLGRQLSGRRSFAAPRQLVSQST